MTLQCFNVDWPSNDKKNQSIIFVRENFFIELAKCRFWFRILLIMKLRNYCFYWIICFDSQYFYVQTSCILSWKCKNFSTLCTMWLTYGIGDTYMKLYAVRTRLSKQTQCYVEHTVLAVLHPSTLSKLKSTYINISNTEANFSIPS